MRDEIAGPSNRTGGSKKGDLYTHSGTSGGPRLNLLRDRNINSLRIKDRNINSLSASSRSAASTYLSLIKLGEKYGNEEDLERFRKQRKKSKKAN